MQPATVSVPDETVLREWAECQIYDRVAMRRLLNDYPDAHYQYLTREETEAIVMEEHVTATAFLVPEMAEHRIMGTSLQEKIRNLNDRRGHKCRQQMLALGGDAMIRIDAELAMQSRERHGASIQSLHTAFRGTVFGLTVEDEEEEAEAEAATSVGDVSLDAHTEIDPDDIGITRINAAGGGIQSRSGLAQVRVQGDTLDITMFARVGQAPNMAWTFFRPTVLMGARDFGVGVVFNRLQTDQLVYRDSVDLIIDDLIARQTTLPTDPNHVMGTFQTLLNPDTVLVPGTGQPPYANLFNPAGAGQNAGIFNYLHSAYQAVRLQAIDEWRIKWRPFAATQLFLHVGNRADWFTHPEVFYPDLRVGAKRGSFVMLLMYMHHLLAYYGGLGPAAAAQVSETDMPLIYAMHVALNLCNGEHQLLDLDQPAAAEMYAEFLGSRGLRHPETGAEYIPTRRDHYERIDNYDLEEAKVRPSSKYMPIYDQLDGVLPFERGSARFRFTVAQSQALVPRATRWILASRVVTHAVPALSLIAFWTQAAYAVRTAANLAVESLLPIIAARAETTFVAGVGIASVSSIATMPTALQTVKAGIEIAAYLGAVALPTLRIISQAVSLLEVGAAAAAPPIASAYRPFYLHPPIMVIDAFVHEQYRMLEPRMVEIVNEFADQFRRNVMMPQASFSAGLADFTRRGVRTFVNLFDEAYIRPWRRRRPELDIAFIPPALQPQFQRFVAARIGIQSLSYVDRAAGFHYGLWRPIGYADELALPSSSITIPSVRDLQAGLGLPHLTRPDALLKRYEQAMEATSQFLQRRGNIDGWRLPYNHTIGRLASNSSRTLEEFQKEFEIVRARILVFFERGARLETPDALAQLELDNRQMLQYLWVDGYRTNEFMQVFLPAAGLGPNPLYGMNISGVSLADCSNWRAYKDDIQASECLTLNQIHWFQRAYNTSVDSRSYFVPIEYGKYGFSIESELLSPNLARQVEGWRTLGEPTWWTRFWTSLSHDFLSHYARVVALTRDEGLQAIQRYQQAVLDYPGESWFTLILKASPDGPALFFSLQAMEGYLQLLLSAPRMIFGTWGFRGRSIEIPMPATRLLLPAYLERLLKTIQIPMERAIGWVQIPQHVHLSDLLVIADMTEWGLSLWVNWPTRLAIGASYIMAQRMANEIWQEAWLRQDARPRTGWNSGYFYWVARYAPQITRLFFYTAMLTMGTMLHIPYSGYFAATRKVLGWMVDAAVAGPGWWLWPPAWVTKLLIYGGSGAIYLGFGTLAGSARFGPFGGALGFAKAALSLCLIYTILLNNANAVNKYLLLQAVADFVFKWIEDSVPRPDRELAYLKALAEAVLPASPIAIRRTPLQALVTLAGREDENTIVTEEEEDQVVFGAEPEDDAAIFVTDFAQIRAYADWQRIASHFKFYPPAIVGAQ